MALHLRAVCFDARDAGATATFWSGLLHRPVVRTGDGLLLPGVAAEVALEFVAADTPKLGPNPLHLHLTGDDVPSADTVAAALELGATALDLGNPADAHFVVLADPEGNEFCVCDGGNSYLAGCGFLGEVACDGSRAVGVFWAAALDWALVWDQDGETAIQSPRGGTKLAWGGEDPAPPSRVDRQRFALAAAQDELVAECARLESLGATVLDRPHLLADPDGTAFTLTPA